MNRKKLLKYYNEGMSLQNTGKYQAAERAYQKALKINPDFVEAYNNLGNVLLDLGKLREAGNAFRKARRLRPGEAMLTHNLANALHLQGEIDKAIGYYDKALQLNPDYLGTHLNLGNALRAVGRYEEAILAYQRAQEIDPANPDPYNNLGGVFLDGEEFDKAVSHFNRAIEINPRHVEACHGLGNALVAQGDMEGGISAYKRTLEINSAHSGAWGDLANALGDMGDLDQAIEAYRRAIEVGSSPGDMYRSLSTLKKFTDYDQDIRAMEALYTARSTPSEQKMYLAYGLGKAFEDIGEYQKSITFILDAARLKRKTVNYSGVKTEELFNRIQTRFSRQTLTAAAKGGCQDATPVFVLGMPRSGTSLVEQILASHPQVYGAGELKILSGMAREFVLTNESFEDTGTVSNLSAKNLEMMGKQYITALRKHSDTARYITDKLPQNFLYIGMIKLILPNAKIIHCCRDPMDNCLSLLKNYFSGAIDYSYDQTELGHYYRLYLSLMDHWKSVFAGQIYDLSYETLVSEPEQQISRLLAHCQLSQESECYNFHQTRRKVRTASNAQVRRPVYRDSVKLWKRYEASLEPLKNTIYGIAEKPG